MEHIYGKLEAVWACEELVRPPACRCHCALPLQNNDFSKRMTIDVCNERTVNECELKKKPFEISTNIGNAQNCQFFCSNIYTTPLRKCQFFIYDQKHDICKLFDFDMMEYDERCKIKGGPKLPDLEKRVFLVD